MSRLRRLVPASPLAKARLATVLVALLSLGGYVPQIGNKAHGTTWHAMSTAALAAIAVVIVATYRRGRALPGDPLLLPVLIIAGGSGLIDAVVTVGVMISVAVPQSLYGSHRAWLLRSAASIVAVPSAVALSPFTGDRPVEWNSPTVLGIIPQMVLLAAVMRAMFVALVRQEEANARESVLARTGSRLLGVTDVVRARSIGRDAIAELARLSPGAVIAVIAFDGDEATVVAGAGFGESPVGTAIPTAALTAVAAGAESHDGLAGLIAHAPGVRHWRGTPLVTKDANRFLLTGATRRVQDGVYDAFRNLSHQVALAEASCLTHAELNHQANHDHLTTLPTRALFFRQLADAIDTQAGTVALLNIDLDDFKQVNDSYGHAAGDELLIQVAARLAEAGGPGTVAARFGGDEFALLLPSLTDPAEAARIAERVCHRIIEPMRLSAATVSVGASIGVAIAEPGLSAGDLARCSDIAMYSAKARGKNRVEQFTAEHHGGIAHHRMLEEHLDEAADRGEIVLRYEPIADLRTGACTTVEAIPHWQHPALGLLQPSEFLPMAERTGRIPALGAHILHDACRQLASWSALPGAADLRIGVNVSARQVLDPGFAATVARILAETGLRGDRLTLEIVESEQMDDEAARTQLRQVAALGVRIALDDFGAGYISLASLRSYPIHQIKMAPTFLTATDDGAMQLVISVGEVLGAETVAQGLAAESDAARLRQTAVTAGQGPLVGGAMAAADVGPWLSDHLARR